MHAVLTTLSARYVHASLAPYCLLAGVRAFAPPAVTAEVVEATVNEPRDAVMARILASRPALVTLSVYIWNRRESAALVSALKAASPALTVAVGGPEVAYDAAAFLDECPADLVLCGEGELAVAQIAAAILEGGDVTAVAGAVSRTAGGVRRVPPTAPLAVPPSPVCEEYLAAVRGRIAYLETSRGCPFACAFCLSGREDGRLRQYPEARAHSEAVALANAGARTVKLVDRTFNADRERARAFWHFLTEEYGRRIPTGVTFHFEVAGDLLEDEDIALLATAPAGLIRLEIGIQSFSRRTLAAVGRRSDPERVAAAVARISAKRNVETHIDLIAGLPYEGLAALRTGFDRALRLSPTMLQLGFLKLLHGTPLREGGGAAFDAAPPYEVVSTPDISAPELDLVRAVAAVTDRVYNSHRYHRTLAYLLEGPAPSPFDLFAAVSHLVPPHGLSHAEYTARLYRCAADIAGVDAERLRDAMVADYLITCCDHALPPCLYREDSRLGQAKRRALAAYPVGKAPRLGVALLYSSRSVLVVEYTEKDPITGEYPYKIIPNEI